MLQIVLLLVLMHWTLVLLDPGNTAIGQGSADAVTTGANNVAVGNDALGAADGDRCTAIGSLALNLGTGGDDCTAIGYLALSVNTASTSTAVGSYAMTANLGGANNTALGFGALRVNHYWCQKYCCWC